jgi:hypothetical protein
MTYITVDVDADDVLREFDEDTIRDFLIKYGDLVITDTEAVREFLEKKDAYGLINFIHKIYNHQIGGLYAELV